MCLSIETWVSLKVVGHEEVGWGRYVAQACSVGKKSVCDGDRNIEIDQKNSGKSVEERDTRGEERCRKRVKMCLEKKERNSISIGRPEEGEFWGKYQRRVCAVR